MFRIPYGALSKDYKTSDDIFFEFFEDMRIDWFISFDAMRPCSVSLDHGWQDVGMQHYPIA